MRDSLYEAQNQERYHIYLRGSDGSSERLLEYAGGILVDRWLADHGTREDKTFVVMNVGTREEISAKEWIEMREHLARREVGGNMKGPFSIFIQHGDLMEYMIEDATGEVVAAWADQNKNADHLKVFVRDEGTRKRYDVDDWVKTWNLRKMFEKADEEPEQQNTDDTQDPLEFLAELGAIADRNMSVQRIVMEAMTDTVKNLVDQNKTDRAKAIGLGQIVQFTTQQIIELFD